MKNKVVTYLKGLKKEQWIVYLLLAALLVVIAIPVNREGGESGSSGGEGSRTGQEAGESVGNDISGSSAETETAAGKEAQMASSLEEALAQVEGVGQVRVVLSLESTNEKVVEKDIPTSSSTQSSSGSDGSTSSSASGTEESTVYQRGSDGTETPYVIRENYPEVRGVLVIAQGGGDPVIVQQIQEAVMALFRVDAHKIKVMKMK